MLRKIGLFANHLLERILHKRRVSGGVYCLFAGLFSLERRYVVEQAALLCESDRFLSGFRFRFRDLNCLPGHFLIVEFQDELVIAGTQRFW